jgi:hypothetical protein
MGYTRIEGTEHGYDDSLQTLNDEEIAAANSYEYEV